MRFDPQTESNGTGCIVALLVLLIFTFEPSCQIVVSPLCAGVIQTLRACMWAITLRLQRKGMVIVWKQSEDNNNEKYCRSFKYKLILPHHKVGLAVDSLFARKCCESDLNIGETLLLAPGT